ncbi:hypothetical protein U1Q18_038328 [Sarracenia purpurea var. burkii]
MKSNWKSLYFSIQKSRNQTWVILLINLFTLAQSDPRIDEAELFCGRSTPPRNATYIPNFVKEMEVLSQLVAADHWGRYVVNSTVPIFGLAQCYQDLSHTDCLLCYAVSRTRLPHCLPAISALIYLDGCFLRYDNYDFFNESVDPVRDKVNCSSSVGEVSGTRKPEFNTSVGELVANLTRAAVLNGGFAVGEAKGVYGLAQCWKTVSSDGCRDCLEKAADQVRGCVPSGEGRGLNAGCYLRYSTTKFYNDGAESLNHRSGDTATGTIVAIALAVAAFLLLSFFASYACYVRLSRQKEGINMVIWRLSDSQSGGKKKKKSTINLKWKFSYSYINNFSLAFQCRKNSSRPGFSFI